MADVFCRKAFDKGGRRGLGLAERDYLHESLIIAGLCHDLGHGPFSHTFDGLVIPRLAPNIKWSHEDASEMLLDDMIDTYHIDIDSNQVRFIKGLISGERKVNYEIGRPA
jgi:HD superfamily phosphohydrolase